MKEQSEGVQERRREGEERKRARGVDVRALPRHPSREGGVGGNKQGGRAAGPLYLSVDPILLQKDGAEASPRMKNLIAQTRLCGVEAFPFVSSSATEDLKVVAPAWRK